MQRFQNADPKLGVLFYFCVFYFVLFHSFPNTAVSILKLTKIHQSNPFVKTKKDVKAIDNLVLSINEGECFCFLGHNGGKINK
jgi:hypothetical protein